MMNVELLHHIYHFPGKNISDAQDKTTCVELAHVFIQFCKEMVRNNSVSTIDIDMYSTVSTLILLLLL